MGFNSGFKWLILRIGEQETRLIVHEHDDDNDGDDDYCKVLI